MNCIGVRRRLSAYTDEQTTAREHLAIGLHLSNCQACRRRFEEMRGIRLALLGMPRVPVPQEFTQGWRARIRRETPAAALPKRRPWVLAAAAAVPAAACVILALAGVALFLPRSQRGAEIARPPDGQARALTAAKAFPAPSEGRSLKSTTPAPEAAMSARVPAPEAEHGFGAPGDTSRRETATGKAPSGVGSEAAAPQPMGESPRAGWSGAATAPRALGIDAGRALAPDGMWRVWLVAVGPRQAALVRAMVSAGLLSPRAVHTSLEAPMLLREGLSYSAAQEMKQMLEEAGGQIVIELVTR